MLRSLRLLNFFCPLILSHPLSERIGKKVYLKMDCLQPTGSFKVRGVGHACQKALVGGYDKLVSSSGGNAGLATAHCGNVLGMDTTVCLPTTATSEVKRKIQKVGLLHKRIIGGGGGFPKVRLLGGGKKSRLFPRERLTLALVKI